MNALPMSPAAAGQDGEHLWIDNLILAVLVLAGGWIAARVPMPGGLPLPFWPPAGVVLAGLLCFGRRALPGLVIGTLLLFYDLTFYQWRPLPILIAGAGLIAQGAAGAWLVRRVQGGALAFTRAQDFGLFLLLGGLLPSLLGSSAWLTGFGLSLTQYWPTAILAQLSGVAIVAPIVFAWALRAQPAWQGRMRTVALPLVLVTALLVALLNPLLGPMDADTRELLRVAHIHAAWWLMSAGLFVCALLAVLLLQLTARSAAVRALVEQRTAELERANAELAREIDVRKRTELRLREAMEEAASAGRLKNEFLGNMSHELRTPLNAVIGMTELALDAELPGEVRAYLEAARSGAGELLTLIDGMIDFSQMSRGGLQIEATRYRLRQLLSGPLKAAGERARAKGLVFQVRIEEALPDLLIGDPGRLRQIVQHLTDNAVKFTAHGGIEVRVSELPGTVGARLLSIEVVDTGIGVPEDHREAIFDPFHQVDASTTRRFGGAGMGLSICRQLARLMGGELELAESTEGRGSRFALTLPLRDREPVAGETPSALVVADAIGNRRMLTEVMSKQGLAVITASDAAEGLALLERGRVDGQPYRLLLIDIDESVEYAFRMVRTLRELQGAAAPSIFILTGHGIRGDAARSRELGVAAYLTKPVTPAELREAVAIVLAGPGFDALVTRHSLRERRMATPLILGVGVDAHPRELVAALEEHGCRATAVCSAPSLRTLCAEREVEAIVLDWDAPELHAPEVVEALLEREHLGRHRPRIIACAVTALEVPGVDIWLPAPLELPALLAALGRAPARAGMPERELS
ncbi:MAG TPA: ATP-binding protein [Plasticicumulans sp.]|nr:ATP-binding protein [Plasticicumulans sp.]